MTNLKIVDPDIDDIFGKLDNDHKLLAYYLIEGCKYANDIFSWQIHPDSVNIIGIFEHLYRNYAVFDPLYDKQIYENIKSYLQFLLTNHGQYNGTFKKCIPAIDKSTIMSLMQLTRCTISPNVLDSLYSSDMDLVVDGSVKKSQVNHYDRVISNKPDNFLEPVKDSIWLNCYVSVRDDKPIIQTYSTKGVCSKYMLLAFGWFKKALELCNDSKTIHPSMKLALTKLMIFLQEGTESALKDYQNAWVNISGCMDFIFAPFEVYMDPLHKIGSYAGEVTIESINLTEFKKIWVKLERDLPYDTEFHSASPPGNMSFRVKIFSSGTNGPARTVSAYCLPNSGNETKQVIYTYANNGNGVYNKHIQDIIDIYPYSVNVAYQMHLILHEWAHSTGKLTKNIDSTIMTSANLPHYIPKDFSSLEELRAELYAIWTFVNNYSDLMCLPDMKKVDKELGQAKFKELYVTLLLNDGIRRMANFDGEPIEAHARANVVLLNRMLSHNCIEIIEEPFVHEGHDLVNIGCKIIDFDKLVNSVRKFVIQLQSIKSTGNGLANERLFGWFVNNPIDKLKMKQYGIKLRKKADAMIGKNRLEVENYPILTLEDKKVTLRKVDYIESFRH